MGARWAAVTSEDVPRDAASPRAFAVGTGAILQVVGMLLFLSTICVCAFAGQWDKVLSRSEVLERHQQNQTLAWSVGDLIDEPARAGMMLLSMFMTVGGLAMTVFGFGLQAQKRRSALGALLTMLLALLVLIVAGIGLWMDAASPLARLWHAGLSLLVLALTLLTINAFKQMQVHPPPPDLYTVPADFNEQAYKRSLRQTDQPSTADLAVRRAALEAELAELDRIESEGTKGNSGT